jgi:hypothetical protein
LPESDSDPDTDPEPMKTIFKKSKKHMGVFKIEKNTKSKKTQIEKTINTCL